VSDLIDTTEMYLRTIFELEEEGAVPLRARIAERLHHSGPTVSQTVARMQRAGLLSVADDRALRLSAEGRQRAVAVMRKHRLAELLLVRVIGMEWEQAHQEACRWEHVMSETVERRLVELLGHPDTSPFGNPIPGLAELGERPAGGDQAALATLADAAASPGAVVVRRISEHLQNDPQLLHDLWVGGVRPGGTVRVSALDSAVLVEAAGGTSAVPGQVASLVFVDPAPTG